MQRSGKELTSAGKGKTCMSSFAGQEELSAPSHSSAPNEKEPVISNNRLACTQWKMGLRDI